MSDYLRIRENINLYKNFYANKNDYFRWVNSDNFFMHQLFNRLHLENNSKILELGMGTGYFLDIIKQKYPFEVHGTEISKEGLETAKIKYHIDNVYLMDTYKLNFPQKSFDVVLAIGHSPFNTSSASHIKKVMLKISPVIRNKGYFIFVFASNFSNTTGKGRIWNSFHNHSRKHLINIFNDLDLFKNIESFSFIRPGSFIVGDHLLSNFNTFITEKIVSFFPSLLTGRILLICRKK